MIPNEVCNVSTGHALPGLVPTAVHQFAPIVEHEQMAHNTYRVRLRAPAIAEQILPGQFFMVRLPGETDPLLGRPFALYDTYDEAGKPAGVDFGYVVVGKMTSLLSKRSAGDTLEIWGPLGNGFPEPSAGQLLMVAGGIGQTPFLAVAREALGLRAYGKLGRTKPSGQSPITLCYGVRSAQYLAGIADFTLSGVEVRISTDDGSFGHHGLVTDLLNESLNSGRPARVYCCGPEPMMHAVAEICESHGIDCWLSLESPMACGFGACFSCVVPVKTCDGGWDYRRACVEGPIFNSRELMRSRIA